MAIKQSVKDKIVISWKNGEFTKQRELARAFGTSAPSVKKILLEAGVLGSNGDNKVLVQKGVEYKKELYEDRTKREIDVIEAMVDEIIDLDELKERAEKYSIAITVENMRLLGRKVSKGTKQIVVRGGKDMGDNIEDIELDTNDHKLIQETVDKALITVGKADRHSPKGDINVSNNQNTGTIAYQAVLPLLDEEKEAIDIGEITNE